MKKKLKKRLCLFSGEEFLPIRSNQLFASKGNRVKYHNDKSNKLRNHLKITNNQILLNYKICIEVLDNSKSKIVHKEFLKGKGFNFSYFTNLEKSQSIENSVSYGLYDLCYEKYDNNNYLISKL